MIAISFLIFLILPLTIDVNDLEIIHCIDDRKTNGYVSLLINTHSYREDITAKVRYEDGDETKLIL